MSSDFSGNAKPPIATDVPRTVIVDQNALNNRNLTPLTLLSANFVDRVIHDLPVSKHLEIFKHLDSKELTRTLNSQEKRLTFWINIYNGYTQYFLKTDPSLYINKRSDFFSKEQIDIAGFTVAMEDIEHGVLRRGATIYTLGYFRQTLFRSAFIKTFKVDHVDYRIHFALNCGAISCPPVVAYQEKWVNKQLDDNSQYYLKREVVSSAKQAWAPALMLWFSADFGSNKDKLAILEKYGALAKKPEGTEGKQKLNYLPYDWSIKIKNYNAFSY